MVHTAGEGGGSGRNSRVTMKNTIKHNNMSNKGKFKPGYKKRENKCIVMFDDKDRQEYLTGFQKRKDERRKAAVVEIQNKIKDEQRRVKEQRHKEYSKMLKERREALDEGEDELEGVITDTTETVQYDHPNHTVTVTTISDIDLTDPSFHGLRNNQSGDENDEEKEEKRCTMPKKAWDPLLNKKICSLTASLHAHAKQGKRKGKQEGRRGRGRPSAVTERKKRVGRTSKKQRRRMTGKRVHHQD